MVRAKPRAVARAVGAKALEREARVRRALTFAALPGVTLARACARYRVPVAALRRARRLLGPVTLSLDDLVLSGLSASRPRTPLELVPYLDWLDHAIYSEAELRVVLRRLVAGGAVKRRGAGFVRAGPWP